MSLWKYIFSISSLKVSGLCKAFFFLFQTTESTAIRKMWFVLPLRVEKHSRHCTYGTVFSLLVPSAGQLPYCITLIGLLQFIDDFTDDERNVKATADCMRFIKWAEEIFSTSALEQPKFV